MSWLASASGLRATDLDRQRQLRRRGAAAARWLRAKTCARPTRIRNGRGTEALRSSGQVEEEQSLVRHVMSRRNPRPNSKDIHELLGDRACDWRGRGRSHLVEAMPFGRVEPEPVREPLQASALPNSHYPWLQRMQRSCACEGASISARPRSQSSRQTFGMQAIKA